MKILLHGYIYSPNYGDMLFARTFYQKLTSLGHEVVFLDCVCAFLRKELNYQQHFSLNDDYDCLVMMSGGYFGQTPNDNETVRYERYIVPCLDAINKNKPLYIIGVGGGGCVKSDTLKEQLAFVCNNATYISVRDSQTKSFLVSYGANSNKIVTTSDTAQFITSATNNIFGKEKILLVHFETNISKDIAKAINDFSSINNYKIYILKDHPMNNIDLVTNIINSASIIVTEKLHCGIIGATLGKSVISIPINYEKTHRYYNEIDQSDRCLDRENAFYSNVLNVLEKIQR